MTMLLLLHAQADVTSAKQIRAALEARGYRVWHEPRTLSLNDPANPRTRAGAVLGCATVVLVWSVEAAQSGDVVPVLPLVEQLTKPVYALLLDNTALPQTLSPVVTLSVQAPCTNVVAQLVPQLPSQQSTDALFTLYEKAAHEYISVRKEAIALAAEMLQRGEEQAQVRAVLEYLASKDSITSVREMAQEMLQAETSMQNPSPQSPISTQPRRYQRSRYDLGKMRQTLDALFTYKIRWLRWARWLFALGSVALAMLIISVIWGV